MGRNCTLKLFATIHLSDGSKRDKAVEVYVNPDGSVSELGALQVVFEIVAQIERALPVMNNAKVVNFEIHTPFGIAYYDFGNIMPAAGWANDFWLQPNLSGEESL